MASDYSGGLSLLSGSVSLGSGTSMQDLIYNKITDQYKDKLQKTSDARSAVYDSKIKYYEAQNEKLLLTSGGIKNATDEIGKAVDGAKKIKDMVFDLKVMLESASKDSDFYAQQFDAKIQEINDAVRDAYGIYNFLGAKSRTNYDVNEYSLQINEKGSAISLTGYNMSVDYMVTDSDGKYWVPDLYSSIKRYDNYDANDLADTTTYSTAQAASSTTSSSTATDKLIARTDTDYSSDAIRFTVGGNSYTGTVSRGGLGLTQSWVYGSFNDAQGIAQAQSDVNSALEDVELMITQLSAMQATTQGAYNTIENSVVENQDIIKNATIAQMQEEYSFASKVKTEYQAAITSLASIAQTQKQYSSIFGQALGDNKLMNYLFNQTV